MTFKKYYNNHNGHYLAFEKEITKILILNKSQIVTKQINISDSLKGIDLNFESLFSSYDNSNNLSTELDVIVKGHINEDWLFLPQHVLVL